MRQNRLFTVINITGTAVTIAFVMVVVMMYDFRISDMAPETARGRYIYSDQAMTRVKANQTDYATSGLGRKPFELLFNNLEGVEDITWYVKASKTICGIPSSDKTSNYFVRPVADNWFKFFEYKFIDGRPFTKEEYDSKRFVSVITKKMALALFGSTDVVGKTYTMNFKPTRIIGVIEDVNSIFQTAYADAFLPYSINNEDYRSSWTDGMGGLRFGVLKLKEGADKDDVKKEIARRRTMLDNLGSKYEIVTLGIYDHVQYSFFRDKDISAPLVYAGLILMLLIVPAINISGLTHAQMQKRESEIAVRKAYGASNMSIIGRLFTENLLSTFIGGIVGYIISCSIMFFCRAWILGSGDVDLAGISFGNGIMLRPLLFLIIFITCLVFNLLSVLLPAWLSMRRNIASTLKGE